MGKCGGHPREEEGLTQGEIAQSSDCVCRATGDKGVGVFAVRSFEVGETVIPGGAVREVAENGTHAVQIDLERFGYEDGIGSMVNHSCDPNCGVKPGIGGIFDLVCRRPIQDGEEISVDYAMRNYVIEFFPAHCLCESPICRRTVSGWKDLPADRRLDYEGSVASFLLEIDHAVALDSPFVLR